jgi:glutamate racemase
MIATHAPLLFLDSGVGGLSVLAPTLELLPNAPVVYVADFAGMPYGEKSEIEVATRVCALLGRLTERLAPRLIVIACNTASTIALSHVRSVLEVPVVGTVPAIKPAALATKTGIIGLLGTGATIRQPYVDKLEAEFAADKKLIRHAAPELVAAAEAKLRGELTDPAIFDAALRGLSEQPGGLAIDQIILGCTHFPLVEPELAAAATRHGLQPHLTFVDGGAGIARRIAHLTVGQPWPDRPERTALCTGGRLDRDAYGPALAKFGVSPFRSV